jgi:hypothetical protein
MTQSFCVLDAVMRRLILDPQNHLGDAKCGDHRQRDDVRDDDYEHRSEELLQVIGIFRNIWCLSVHEGDEEQCQGNSSSRQPYTCDCYSRPNRKVDASGLLFWCYCRFGQVDSNLIGTSTASEY